MASFPRHIYPCPSYTLRGLVWRQNLAITLDAYRGYLLAIDPFTESTTILNPLSTHTFQEATDLSVTQEMLWIVRDKTIYYCKWGSFDLEVYLELPDPIEGITVSEGGVYVSSAYLGKIFVFGRATRGLLRVIDAPGCGQESLTLRGEELWVSDRMEETIYCVEAKTGKVRYRALTPYPDPVGLAFLGEDGNNLYVVHSGDEFFIRENPNDPDSPTIEKRDKGFLHYQVVSPVIGIPSYTLSNGYLVEMIYLEEIFPEEPQSYPNITWSIALPSNTHRQKLRSVTPMGIPFTIREMADQQIADFSLGKLHTRDARVFGWKALLELRGIKYEIPVEALEEHPILPAEMQARYLIDDDDLGMDHPTVKEAARQAIGDATNIVTKMLRIREYVYDKLEYRMESFDTPDLVLEKGWGGCGEYVGVMLALARLNGIACRTAGRYKCPPFADQKGISLIQYYNHVWLEFFVPGMGWLPLESNPDDTGRRPYPTRFFMGLPWYHIEIGKGVPFETIAPDHLSIGALALNHVRFRILEELS